MLWHPFISRECVTEIAGKKALTLTYCAAVRSRRYAQVHVKYHTTSHQALTGNDL